MSDYATPSFRKSRKEKRLKGKFSPYKHGGKHRTEKISV